MPYILLPLVLLAISPGVETMQFLLSRGDDLSRAWVMFVPYTVVYLFMVPVVNDRWLMPRYLLRGKFGAYIVSAVAVVAFISLLVSGAETFLRMHLDLPGRVSGSTAGWLFADTVSNVFFWVPLMVGFSLIKLYGRWKRDMRRERQIAESLERYMARVRDWLNPRVIFARLDEIGDAIGLDAELASSRVADLSDYLRAQLEAMSPPPKLRGSRHDSSLFSGLTSLLVGKRYRAVRHLVLIAGLVTVSYIAFIREYPVDFKDALMQSMSLFLYLAFLTYLDILLFRIFGKRSSMRAFVISVSVMALIFILPMAAAIPFLSDEIGAHGSSLAVVIEASAILAGIIGLLLYVAGLSALLVFRKWIRVQRNLTFLRAETLRQEYLFLRKQINPHFLFNVLNNIGISVYDDAALAGALLNDLSLLLRNQLEEGKKEMTTIGKEVEFLSCYLSLEQSRRDGFRYLIEVDEKVGKQRIPTLLFIPMIENAVKYCVHSGECREVEARFYEQAGYLRFECRNPYDEKRVERMSHHGIGLDNVRRRLALIYEGRASVRVSASRGIFCVTVKIPLGKEIMKFRQLQ